MLPTLLVQPTPLPWSARHAQMSSRITCEELTTRLSSAWPGVAPPMRKNTSCSRVGSPGFDQPRPGSPTCSSAGEFTGPASNIMPDSFTPGTLATSIARLPCAGTRVGKPRPSTTVSGRVTTMGWLRLYTPGVRIRFLPSSSAASISPTGVLGLAMKNRCIGMADPGVGPLPQVVPTELCWTAGTNTL